MDEIFDKNITPEVTMSYKQDAEGADLMAFLAETIAHNTGMDSTCATSILEKTKDEGWDIFSATLDVRKIVEGTLDKTESSQARLKELNRRHVYVKQMSRVWDMRTRGWKSPNEFISDYSKETVWMRRKGKLAELDLGYAWLHWQDRSDVETVDYMPGHDGIVTDPLTGERSLSIWAGWGVAPMRNDKLARYGGPDGGGMWHRFLKHRSKPQTAAEQAWELAWFYAPIRFAGMKNHSSIVMRSDQRGVGKTLQCEIIAAIYGPNAIVFDKKSVQDNHNSDLATATFGFWDEMADPKGADMDDVSNTLKSLITSEKHRINPKNQKPFHVTNHLNLVCATNKVKLGLVEIGDMKFWVSGSNNTPLSEEEYKELGEAKKNGSLPSAIFYDILNNPLIYPRDPAWGPEPSEQEMWDMSEDEFADLQDKMMARIHDPRPNINKAWDKSKGPRPLLWGWNPEKRPAATREKRETQEISMTSIDSWLTELATDFEGVSAPLYAKANCAGLERGRLLICAKEVRMLYRLAFPRAQLPTVNTIGAKLKTILLNRKVTIREGAASTRTAYWLMLLPAPQEPDATVDEIAQLDWQRTLCKFIDAAAPHSGSPSALPTHADSLAEGCLALSAADRKLGPHKDDLKQWCEIPVNLTFELENSGIDA